MLPLAYLGCCWILACHVGLLDALQNESPPSKPSPTSAELLGPVYHAPTEPSLLADGLIEPVRDLPWLSSVSGLLCQVEIWCTAMGAGRPVYLEAPPCLPQLGMWIPWYDLRWDLVAA